MKRKSRSKSSFSDKKSSKNRGEKNAGRGGSAEESSTESRTQASGRSDRDQDGGRRTTEKRPIKNARSLRDVLGLGGGQKQGQNQSRSGAPVARSVRGGAIEPEGGRDEAPKGVSKKLTYIMRFQPPEDSLKESPQKSQPASPNKTTVKATVPEKVVAAPVAPIKRRAEPVPERKAKREEREPKPEQKREGRRETSRDGRRSGKRSESLDAAGSAHAGTHPALDRVTGLVKRHPDGFGFLLPDDKSHPDVYISRQSMNGVMTNDRVEVQIYKPRHKGAEREERLAGEVTQILSHSTMRVVGPYLPVDRKYGVILDGTHGWGADLRIAAKDAMGAKEGDLVAVEITQYPGPNTEFTGEVVALIGSLEDPMNDVIRVIHQAGIPNEFSKAVQEEVKEFGTEVGDEDFRGREDLTLTTLITVDGATAKDFDDAIYTEATEKGFRCIVAIADVSHYVKPGTKLDEEAYERGTSTYFPNFVVPMLPEELSNELCSIKPEVTRLCFACEMHLDFSGVVQKYRFFEAVMESKARVIYGEAQEVLDGRPPARFSADVRNNIKTCADLAKILMQKRFREGSLDLEIPETQVVVDQSGTTVDIIRSERLFAHRMIEELMLVTNICTARFMDENEIPGIYRIHEEPDPDNIKALQRYLWNFGGHRSVMGGGLQKKLTKALHAMDGKPESQVLNILTLRTMRQAQYSETNVGHFGLGFSHYSHFTSPIRRYPDLIAHRLIKSQIYPRYRGMEMTESDLATATTFLSGCEQRSTKAERQVISIKKARFIRQFIGQEFEGVISSVAKFGVFVLLRQYDVDGLVKIENLGPDRFVFDDENLRLIGPRTGLRYTIGDVVKVRVTAADTEQGKVDFALAEEPKVVPHDDEDDEFDDHPRKENVSAGSSNEREARSGGRKRKGQNASKKGNRVNAEERGSSANNSRGVREERVSKRRRKN